MVRDFQADINETAKVLGKDNVDCLNILFQAIDGAPPCVEKKRFRANHPDYMKALDNLEHTLHLIETITYENQQCYVFRPYALPLMKSEKAQKLISFMGEIHHKFQYLYKERLEEPVMREEFFKMLKTPSPKVEEALYYLIQSHNICSSRHNHFPYEEKSYICLSEGILSQNNLLENLTDYYHWHFIGKTQIQALNMKKPEVRKVGRPDNKFKIREAYKTLSEQGLINYEASLSANVKIIQDAIIEMFSDMQDDKGIGPETIRLAIGEQFKTDKENSNKLSNKL